MKKVGKPVFFIVAILIFALAYTSIFGIYGENGDFKITYIKGVSDIRWGIDIKGGVEATFKPSGNVKATAEQMSAAKSVIELRLVTNNITDYELYQDNDNGLIIVRYPWKEDEENFDPSTAIEELAATAKLTFREGNSYTTQEYDSNGELVYKTPSGTTASHIYLDGSSIKSASADYVQLENGGKAQYIVSLELTDEGRKLFKEATTELSSKSSGQNVMSIWMDDTMISAPTVESVIDSNSCMITGGNKSDGSAGFTASEATALANKINAGALPFELEVDSYGSINPTLGDYALFAMALAGIIALALIIIFMIVYYRLPGFVASIALIGQVALSLAAVSGYFPFASSFTMTLAGISGIILSVGMGIDANVITSERIKDELYQGKTLDGCIRYGTKNSFSAIFDGNITNIIVALILMLVFGPANILSGIFGASTTGAIYAFGYTLLVGVIANFVMGVFASRLMLMSLSRFKFLRNKKLYGGK